MVMKKTTDPKGNDVLIFNGLVRWCNIPPNDPRPGPAKYIRDTNKDDLHYSIEVECSEKEFASLKKLNLPSKTNLKLDEETKKTYLRIKASKVKTNNNSAKNNGENYVFEDIPVKLKNGAKCDKPAANGSSAVVIAQIIEGDADEHSLRLLSVMFTDFIEYNRGVDTDALLSEYIEPETEEEIALAQNDADQHAGEGLDDDEISF